MRHLQRKPTLAVVGGGLAGLAAAVAAAGRGWQVDLFERSSRLGGRAGSFRDPETGGMIDYCQHVAMGCCTNLLASFCSSTGMTDSFRPSPQLHFFGPEGRRHDWAASRFLPAPFHLLPALRRLKYLSLGERLNILRTIGQLASRSAGRQSPDEQTTGTWLRQEGQSERAIEWFWSVVLVSALGETVERVSQSAARKVFRVGFLSSRDAHRLFVPNWPLGELLDRRVAARLSRHHATIHRGARVTGVEADGCRAATVVLADGTRREFDFVVVAVSWRQVCPLLPEPVRAAMPELQAVEQIRPSPITAVHLWFDRPLSALPHAVLVGKLSQWVFNRGCCNVRGAMQPAHYYQAIISASHALLGRSPRAVLAEVRRDLEAIWPDVRGAAVLHWRIITHPAAVFSARPGVEKLRPPQRTPFSNLLLAGDWTATGWPATMEGAVRSGYLAVEEILKSRGEEARLLAADLPGNPLVRMLLGAEE